MDKTPLLNLRQHLTKRFEVGDHRCLRAQIEGLALLIMVHHNPLQKNPFNNHFLKGSYTLTLTLVHGSKQGSYDELSSLTLHLQGGLTRSA